MRYALYLRKSRLTEQGESIENQETLCRAYLAQSFPEDQAPCVTVFQDEGFSGKSFARPQFQKMLLDIKKNAFDYVVCYRLDRISRNIADFSSLVQLLAAYNTGFISIRERFDTSNPMGRAMMYISSVFSQLERETIAERIRDNMEFLAKTGIWLGGNTPTGFTSQKRELTNRDGRRKTVAALTPLPGEWETVSLIFHSFLAEPQLPPLLDRLDTLGVRTKRGNPYTASSLRGILSNPVYCAVDKDSYAYFEQRHCILCISEAHFVKGCGYLAYHKNSFQSGRRKSQPQESWILSCGEHPPILSGKDWALIQRQLVNTNITGRHARKVHNPYCLFAGLLVCHSCLSPMRPKLSSHLQTPDRIPVFYYLCQTKETSKKTLCQMQNLHGNQTDQELESFIVSQLLTPNALAESIKKRLQKQTQTSATPSKKEDAASIQKQIDKLLALLLETEDGRLLSLYQNQLKCLCKKKDTLEQTPSLQNCLHPSVKSNIALFLDKLQDPLSYFHALPVPSKRAFLHKVVQKVAWDGITLSITWAKKNPSE